MKKLLLEAAQRSIQYRETLNKRSVTPDPKALKRLGELHVPFPQKQTDPLETLKLLDEIGSPATTATTGGRFFGFVVGSSLPITVAANWLAGAWDQESGQVITSPIGAKLEEVCSNWLVELFCLPSDCGVGFVTGATMGNFSGLAAARHALLSQAGWDVESQGLFGAPPIKIITGEDVHASVLKAIGLLGLGRDNIIKVPTDSQGRMIAKQIPKLKDPQIICAQVGHVATGACDPLPEICARAKENGAWVHVDGAFGMWASASPKRNYLVHGLAEADSWATDCHKWLNVPYDSGLVFVKNEEHLRAAMSILADYLDTPTVRQPDQYVPEMSRRARAVEIWAALHSLGREGLADLIEKSCKQAVFFAEGFRNTGYEVLNDVVLNQVLISFGGSDLNQKIIHSIQKDGTCWCGGTTWQGKKVMRLSVSSWKTTQQDCEISLQKILQIAAQEKSK